MSKIKLFLLLVLILAIAGIAYFLWQPSKAQYDDYRALFCLVVQNPATTEQKQILEEMEKVQHHSFPDYALQKPDFKPRFANKIYAQYQDLSAVQQKAVRQSIQTCEATFTQ